MKTIRVRFKDIKTGQYFTCEADGISYRKITLSHDGIGIVNARGVTTRNVVRMKPNERVIIKVSGEE